MKTFFLAHARYPLDQIDHGVTCLISPPSLKNRPLTYLGTENHHIIAALRQATEDEGKLLYLQGTSWSLCQISYHNQKPRPFRNAL